jgi:hypothetical protein
MGEQGVQEGTGETEHAPLWGPIVEDHRSGGVVSYFRHLGAACQVQDSITHGGFETQGLKHIHLKDTMVLNAGQIGQIRWFLFALVLNLINKYKFLLGKSLLYIFLTSLGPLFTL